MTTLSVGDAKNETFVFIEVAGLVFEDWTDYHITSDLLSPVDSFSFHTPILRENLTPRALQERGIRRGARVRIFVKTKKTPKPVLQHVGIVDDLVFEEERGARGASLTVTGRGALGQIVDADLIARFSLENVTLQDVIYRTLVQAPPGRDRGYFDAKNVVVSNDANRVLMTGAAAAGAVLTSNAPLNLEHLKVDQAQPHPGETVFHFLERHARRFGLLIWGTADGKIVFGRPNYDQKPLYPLWLKAGAGGRANTVMRARRGYSTKHRPSELHVFGHSHGHDQFASPVHAVVYDEEIQQLGFYKPISLHDNNARDIAQATQRAKFEMSRHMQTADCIHMELDGHGSEDGTIYAIDTIADVQWDKGEVHGPMYVIRRSFSRDRGAGTLTSLDLVPKGVIAVGEVSYSTKLSTSEAALVKKHAAATPEVPVININDALGFK